jgi:uncharacterized protein
MSGKKRIKIVLDTNIWIGFLIGKKLSSLKGSIINGEVQILFSERLSKEIATVIQYTRLKRYFTSEDFSDLMALLAEKISFIEPSSSVTDCRDPKDNFLLDLAVSAGADYLVTGDKDLLVLNPFRGVKIIKAEEMERILCEM